MPRTESECTSSSLGDDDDLHIIPLHDGDSFVNGDTEKTDENKDEKSRDRFLTLRQRRQIKLGIRKVTDQDRAVLPLNVLIPHAAVTDKNRKWYDALKKVWNHKDPWLPFHLDEIQEKVAIRHKYNPIKQKWSKDKVRVKMEDKPFNRGAMRQCFRLKKISKFCHSENWAHAGNYVAKKYMESVDRSVYFEDVKLQMDAKLWADEYNRHHPPKKIDIFQMYIIELVNDEGSPLYHLEHFIEGEYIKYNSNSGFVEDTKQCRYTPQAFSHFTFERSGHELIVVDIQGVGDLYTDPQIHTMDGLMYGDGNLGTKGMALFFHSHECNEICRGLGLEQFNLSVAEIRSIHEHHASSPSSETHLRGIEDHVISPTQEERGDLKRMLSNSSNARTRTLSSLSDLGSLPEGEYDRESSPTSPQEADTGSGSFDSGLHKDYSASDAGIDTPHSECCGSSRCGRRPHLQSVSSDDCYPYDTSDCSSSIPSNKSSLTKAMEHKLYGLKTQGVRSSSIDAEHQLRDTHDFHLGDSILGQIHHEVAKYYEIGRFALDGDESLIDWESAVYHERLAADLGVPEAIVTMAKIYLGLPHDVLVDYHSSPLDDKTNEGVEYMIQAANANDRASILYMAKAFHSGTNLGTARERSYKDAVEYYQKAVMTQEHDDHGNFDSTMSDPNYQLLANMAELYRSGGYGLEKDPNRAGELYTEAADEAMTAMKGRLANQYYMKAEEAWAEVED